MTSSMKTSCNNQIYILSQTSHNTRESFAAMFVAYHGGLESFAKEVRRLYTCISLILGATARENLDPNTPESFACHFINEVMSTLNSALSVSILPAEDTFRKLLSVKFRHPHRFCMGKKMAMSRFDRYSCEAHELPCSTVSARCHGTRIPERIAINWTEAKLLCQYRLLEIRVPIHDCFPTPHLRKRSCHKISVR
jgi:hypothetical protein